VRLASEVAFSHRYSEQRDFAFDFFAGEFTARVDLKANAIVAYERFLQCCCRHASLPKFLHLHSHAIAHSLARTAWEMRCAENKNDGQTPGAGRCQGCAAVGLTLLIVKFAAAAMVITAVVWFVVDYALEWLFR